jgi:hypothetical protein
MTRPSRPTKDVAAAFSGRGKTELYEWLWRNFDRLPPYQRYRVSWQKLVTALTDLRITGRDASKPLTVDIVRKTYERVQTDRAAAEAAARARAAVRGGAEAGVGAGGRGAPRRVRQRVAPMVTQAALPDEPDDEGLRKHVWTPTKLK